MKMNKKKIRVLSGIRASHSSLHLGNLEGAIRGMIKLQNDPKYETFYMVADLHGITTPFNPEKLKRNRLEIAKDYLAAGIDPKKSVLFLQADVSEHVELAYYLSSAVRHNRVKQLPGKKEEYREHPERVSVALLNYPVLMAADILAYKAEIVPIGLDQEPHLDITREIARNMNLKYDLDFPEPQRFAVVAGDFTVPSILGGGKMSKTKKGSVINLSDSYEVIKQKVARIPTDIGKAKKIEKDTGAYALFLFVELFMGKPKKRKLERDYLSSKGIKYSEIKAELAKAIYKKLKPIQEKRRKYENDPKLVREILDKGAEKARKIAGETLNEVKEAMGLV